MHVTFTPTLDPSIVIVTDGRQSQFFTIENSSGELVQDSLREWFGHYLRMLNEVLYDLRRANGGVDAPILADLKIRRGRIKDGAMIEFEVDHLYDPSSEVFGTTEEVALALGHCDAPKFDRSAQYGEFLLAVKVRRRKHAAGRSGINRRDYKNRAKP